MRFFTISTVKDNTRFVPCVSYTFLPILAKSLNATFSTDEIYYPFLTLL